MLYLLTLISLMIGVFSASICAILSIKAFGEKWVVGKTIEAEEMYALIDKLSKGSFCKRFSKIIRNAITHFYKVWRLLFLVPIVVFSLWAFSTAFYVTGGETCKSYFVSSIPDNNAPPASLIVSNGKESTHIGMPWFLGRTVLLAITCIYSLSIVVAVLILIIIWGLMALIRAANNHVLKDSQRFQP